MSDTPTHDTPMATDIPGPSPMLPGVAALLLVRGCPVERLDDALVSMSDKRLPGTLAEAVEHVDAAIAELGR